MHYKKAKTKISEKDIELFVEKNVASHEIVQMTSDIVFLPYLWALLSLTMLQCFCCSVPILWYKGCCCFFACSSHRMKGTIDKKTGDVFISLRKYKKYGSRNENKIIE